MITLYISSCKDISDIELVSIFKKEKIKCQVTKTLNTNIDNDNFIIENGYKILIFDIDGVTFKDRVWSSLKKNLDIKCGFVKYRNEYMGCVLNWPGVFTKSNCLGCM